jgi:hypothetical protein
MSDTRVGRPAEIAGPGLALWEAAREPDVRRAESLDRGPSRGTAADTIHNVKRVSEVLGPVGFAWGWEVRGERLDTFGLGEEQRVIHTCVLRAWFRQPDGSKGDLEHVGRTRAAYWARPRRPGEGPRYVVDEEFAKKSVTDALSKIMVSLGASADIWLGRFDGNKYVPPATGNGHEQEDELPAPRERAVEEDGLVAEARSHLHAVRGMDGATLREARNWLRLSPDGTKPSRWLLLGQVDRDLRDELAAAMNKRAADLGISLKEAA